MAAFPDLKRKDNPNLPEALFGAPKSDPALFLKAASVGVSVAREFVELNDGVAAFATTCRAADEVIKALSSIKSASDIVVDLTNGLYGRAVWDAATGLSNLGGVTSTLNRHTINEAGEGLISKGFTSGLDIITKCALAVTQGVELVYSTYKVFTVEGDGAGVLRGSLLFTIGRAVSYIALAVLALLSVFAFATIPVWAITAALASATTFQIVNLLYDRSMGITEKCSARRNMINW